MKALFAVLLCVQFSLAQNSAALRGYPAAAAAQQRQWEQKYLRLPDAARITDYSRRMAASPHPAGSVAGKAVADYALSLLRSWGWQAEIETFEALLPYPTTRLLEMTAPVRFTAGLTELPLADDPATAQPDQLPTFNAYAASGDVTAPLVYVNFGGPEDYEELARQRIDVRGKIVIARYGRSWRGAKPKLAQEHGAAGCLIYSDPHEDGYFAGDVYPLGPYRPAHGVQRGSVIDMSVYPGDPLSPGWASEPDSNEPRRLARKDAATIMKIPVLPISYADAQPLLAQLGGAVVPEEWRGALPITYHFGPGNTMVHVKTDFDWTVKKIYNVIATLPGTTSPDDWILYGNHHDAWVNGANDPVSGAASLLETARSLGELRQQGWQPQRTIKFALWDGEEFGLIGSTEWGEKHDTELSAKAVAYFNSDSNGRGGFGIGGSPLLESFVAGLLPDLKDPGSGTSLLAAVTAPRSPRGTSEEAPFRLNALGAGSDYVVFAHHLGITSLNAGFGSADSGGVYHSIYDSLAWFERFSDGDRAYGRALSQFYGLALMRLADAPVLPTGFAALGRALDFYLEEIARDAQHRGHHLVVGAIPDEVTALRAAAAEYEQALTALSTRASELPAERFTALNAALVRTERLLLNRRGLPGREWFRSQLAAPGLYTGYSAKTLPSIREAVEAGRFAEANEQARVVGEMVRNLTRHVQAITRQARSLSIP